MRALSDNMRGALLMMGSMAAFTLNDACMKVLMGDIPLFQAIFLRGLLTVLVLVVLSRWLGGLRFRMPRKDWALVLTRSLSEIGATYFFITALFHMPIANVTAILQVLPLTVTLSSAMLFGDKLGWRRLLAIMVGFVGVMIIVRDGLTGLNTYALYALCAVFFVTVRDLCARRLSVGVSSVTIALIGAIGVVGFAAVGSYGATWEAVSGKSIALLAAAAFFIIGGYLFSIMTMRVGEISFIAPFRYTSLLWALLLGFVVFGDWPDHLTMLGIVIVVVTGAFTFYRERKLALEEASAQ